MVTTEIFYLAKLVFFLIEEKYVVCDLVNPRKEFS